MPLGRLCGVRETGGKLGQVQGEASCQPARHYWASERRYPLLFVMRQMLRQAAELCGLAQRHRVQRNDIECMQCRVCEQPAGRNVAHCTTLS